MLSLSGPLLRYLFGIVKSYLHNKKASLIIEIHWHHLYFVEVSEDIIFPSMVCENRKIFLENI